MSKSKDSSMAYGIEPPLGGEVRDRCPLLYHDSGVVVGPVSKVHITYKEVKEHTDYRTSKGNQ